MGKLSFHQAETSYQESAVKSLENEITHLLNADRIWKALFTTSSSLIFSKNELKFVIELKCN